MRKNTFIGIGLSAVTTATMAFSAVSIPAAHASGSVTNQVCATKVARNTDATAASTAADSALAAANAGMVGKLAAMTTAQNGLTNSLVSYIQVADLVNGDIATALSGLNNAVSVFSDKAAAWSNATDAVNLANKAVAITAITNGPGGILPNLFSGLGCP
jgi:hypothetical protein